MIQQKQRMIKTLQGWMTAEADFMIIYGSRGHWSVLPMNEDGVDWNNEDLQSHIWNGVKQDAINEIAILRNKQANQ